MAHLDGVGTEDAAAAMVQRVTELAIGFPEGRLELQLVGGYSDPRNYSEEVFCNILCKPCFTPLGSKCRSRSRGKGNRPGSFVSSRVPQAAGGDRSDPLLRGRVEHHRERRHSLAGDLRYRFERQDGGDLPGDLPR